MKKSKKINYIYISTDIFNNYLSNIKIKNYISNFQYHNKNEKSIMNLSIYHLRNM